jgi:hypothetical protein
MRVVSSGRSLVSGLQACLKFSHVVPRDWTFPGKVTLATTLIVYELTRGCASVVGGLRWRALFFPLLHFCRMHRLAGFASLRGEIFPFKSRTRIRASAIRSIFPTRPSATFTTSIVGGSFC